MNFYFDKAFYTPILLEKKENVLLIRSALQRLGVWFSLILHEVSLEKCTTFSSIIQKNSLSFFDYYSFKKKLYMLKFLQRKSY